MPLTIQLKGWKQILAGAAVLVVLLASYTVFMQRELDTKLPSLLRQQLKIDVGRETMERIIPGNNRNVSPTREQAEALVKENQAIENLKIVSIEKRGWGSKLVVRVKFTTGESNIEQTRYYRLKHNWLGGWHVWSRATETSYTLGWL